MSILFTDTITVYNHHRDPDADKDVWIRTVVKGVQWTHDTIETVISNGVQTETRAETITVDFQRRYDGNKPYVDPAEYRKIDAAARSACWTLDARSQQDVVVLGEVMREISQDYRLKDLYNDFQYVATVKSVADNRNRPRLKHIKVVAV